MSAYARKNPPIRLTPQQYLARERVAETRSEYDGGFVVAMVGASWEHNVITGNVERILGNQFEGGDCVAVSKDQRVRVPECDRYYYPDTVVVCDEPQFEDAELDTLLNPTLILEVLSETTEARDRGEKLDCYQTIESLNTYILISANKPLLEVYQREDEGWHYSKTKDIQNTVQLESLGCALRLADVYSRIRFQRSNDQQNDDESAASP